jgi:PKD repeat protein
MKYTTLIVLAILIAAQSRAQSYQWVKGGGSIQTVGSGTMTEMVFQMATDANGNVYALSYMNNDGPITADTFYRVSGSYGFNESYFLSSYTCDGQMRWAKLIGSSGGDLRPYGLTVDDLGHVYVAGLAYNATLHIGYDTSLSSYTNQLQAIMQFDTSGNYHWMRYIGDNSYATHAGALWPGSSVGVDSNNNVHFFCSMKYGVPITTTMTSHRGTYDLKYDVSGNLVDVKRLQLDSTRQITNVAIDRKSDKIYAIGANAVFPAGVYERPFIASFDLNRNLIWEDTLSSASLSGACGCGFVGLKTDGAGNIYAAGLGDGTVVYNGDTARNEFGSYGISFLMKADTGGNSKWIRTYSGTAANKLQDLSFVSRDKIVAVGIIAGKIKTGYDSITLTVGLGQNPFFTVVDTAGSLFTLQQVYGDGFYDWGTAITSDQKGGIYLGGRVEHQIWAGILSPYTSHGGTSDFFVMKYGANCDCINGPTASFNAVGTHTITFTYTGTPGSTPLDSVRWYFGDGGTSTTLNPVHVYTTGGTFSACVRVYSSCGGDVECKDVVITCPYTPVASFTQLGVNTKTFTYTGTTAGVDSMRWRFGDGATSTLTNPSHTYTATGTYTACVSIYTWCAWDSSCITFTVPCIAAPPALYSYTGTDDTRMFTYTGPTTLVDSIRWDFGDGAIITSSGISATHIYTAIGTYTVCGTFFNACGTSSICHTISVPCLGAATAAFTHTTSHDSTGHFTYTGSTTGIDSVKWQYGDGHTGNGITAVHHYTVIGTFTVCAVAYSQCGNDTLCDTIKIISRLGIADYIPMNDIKVLPNPAEDMVTIENAVGCTVDLFDLTGRKIESVMATSSVEKMSVAVLPSGVYIMRITNSAGDVKQIRLVKQ